jgi:NTE family protein
MGLTFDVVFQGGGARGIVLNGAVERLEERGHRIDRVIGTSAGAIAASLVACGFSGAELAAMSRGRRPDGLPEFAEYIADVPTDRDVTKSALYNILLGAETSQHVPRGIADVVARHLSSMLLHVPGLRSAFSFFEDGGVHSGGGFVNWMRKTLDAKRPGLASITLGSLFELTGRDLTIVATDTTSARMLVLNHRTSPNLPVVWATRMSMSIPLFFEEVLWAEEWGTYLGENLTGHVVVDGGVLSNFPLRFILPDASEYVRAFMGTRQATGSIPLGLHIDPLLEVEGAPPSSHAPDGPVFARVMHARLAQRVMRLVETMLDGNDDTFEEVHRAFICPLPAKGYWATEFDMQSERVEALLNAGRNALDAYLTANHSGAAA